MSEKYSLALWSASTGAALSGAYAELRIGASSYAGSELGASGKYVWASIPKGKYELWGEFKWSCYCR